MKNWTNEVEPPHFNGRENSEEQGKKLAPEYDTDLTIFAVKPSEWQHVCTARFGEARACGRLSKTKWNGDCYRYDIYKRKQESYETRPQFALRWWNGGGYGWLVGNLMNSGQLCLLEIISTMPDEARRWDACHFIYQTAEKTARASARFAQNYVFRAFVEKRLKARRKSGRVYMEIKQANQINREQVAA